MALGRYLADTSAFEQQRHSDFDLIAEVTGLSARWILPAGTGHGGAV